MCGIAGVWLREGAPAPEVLAAMGDSEVAVRRHARPGPEGVRDLSHVGLAIGSGGILRHSAQEESLGILRAVLTDRSGGWRLPHATDVTVDADYLLAPIGLLALGGREAEARALATRLLAPG